MRTPLSRKPQEASSEKAAFWLRYPSRAEALKKTTGRPWGSALAATARAKPAIRRLLTQDWILEVMRLNKVGRPTGRGPIISARVAAFAARVFRFRRRVFRRRLGLAR